jgi:HlyD family secretion protein
LVSQIGAQRAAITATTDQAGAARKSGTAARSQTTVAARKGDSAAAAVFPADLGVRECTLLAPRAGMVATRVHEPGEPVLPGTVVLTITDLTEARTRFYLPNAELAAAAPGRRVHVVADAYPGTSFEGTIFFVAPRAEFTPRNVQTREDRERLVYAVEVRIPNQDMRLRSGMPVEVTIDGPQMP